MDEAHLLNASSPGVPSPQVYDTRFRRARIMPSLQLSPWIIRDHARGLGMSASAQGSLTSNGRWNRSCRTGTHCFLVVQPEAGDATGSMDGSELERRERASRLRRTHKNRFDRALDSVRDINSIPRTRAGRGRGAGPLRPVRSDLFHPDRGGVNMPTCEDQSTGPHSNPFCIPYLALLGASAMPGPDTNSQGATCQ